MTGTGENGTVKVIATSVRLPSGLLERADRLVPVFGADADVVGVIGEVSRSYILRLALLRGLRALETELAISSHDLWPVCTTCGSGADGVIYATDDPTVDICGECAGEVSQVKVVQVRRTCTACGCWYMTADPTVEICGNCDGAGRPAVSLGTMVPLWSVPRGRHGGGR